MIRNVEDVTAYELQAPQLLVPIGQGVTHYRTAWSPTLVGDHVEADLIAAGLPESSHAWHDPDSDELHVTVLLDDAGRWSGVIETYLALHIEG